MDGGDLYSPVTGCDVLLLLFLVDLFWIKRLNPEFRLQGLLPETKAR